MMVGAKSGLTSREMLAELNVSLKGYERVENRVDKGRVLGRYPFGDRREMSGIRFGIAGNDGS